MIKQFSALITGLVGMLKLATLRSLKITSIKNEDLYFLGWFYALINLSLGALSLAAGQWSRAALLICCGLVSSFSLVYIGKNAGEKASEIKDIVAIRLELDRESARLLSALLRQSLQYCGPNAIELTGEGRDAVQEIAGNIEAVAGNKEGS